MKLTFTQISAAVDAAIAAGRIARAARDQWVTALARDENAAATLAAKPAGQYDSGRRQQVFSAAAESQLRDPNSDLAKQLRTLVTQAAAQESPTAQSLAVGLGRELDRLQNPTPPAAAPTARPSAAGAPMPELFPGSGALPVVTASGIDPQVLASVPWQARPLIARTQSPAKARELIARYAAASEEMLAADRDLEPDIKAYQRRAANAAWEATHPGWKVGHDGLAMQSGAQR